MISPLTFAYSDSLPQISSKLSPSVPSFPFTCLILPLHLCAQVYLGPFLSQVGYLTSENIVPSHCKGCDLSFLLVNEQQEDYPLSLYLRCLIHCLELRAYLISANAILILQAAPCGGHEAGLCIMAAIPKVVQGSPSRRIWKKVIYLCSYS